MFRINLSGAFILFVPLYILAMLYLLVFKKKTIHFIYRFTLIYGFMAYLLTLFSLTLLPDAFHPLREGVSDPLMTLQLVPFRTIMQTFRNDTWFIQFLGNIVVFMPFTVLIGLLSEKELSFKKGVFFGFLFSLFIEISQLIINLLAHAALRSPDVDDLILNTLGGLIGCLVYKITIHISQQLSPVFKTNSEIK